MTDESGGTERKRDHGEIVIEQCKELDVVNGNGDVETDEFWVPVRHSELVGAFKTVQQAEMWLREKVVAGEMPLDGASYRIIRVVRASIVPKIEQRVKF